MSKLFNILALIVIVCTFYSCSWVEGFFVINSTSNELRIEIELLDSIAGNFPIFDYKGATVYELNKSNKINYEKSTEITYDTLSGFAHITFKLPAKSAVQIGTLHNDKYKNCNQSFINGRVFNLEKLTIKTPEIIINKINFDKCFKKDRNGISYLVE